MSFGWPEAVVHQLETWSGKIAICRQGLARMHEWAAFTAFLFLFKVQQITRAGVCVAHMLELTEIGEAGFCERADILPSVAVSCEAFPFHLHQL